MYTDTGRGPNHLAQEVIDNAVDEALAGHAPSDQVVPACKDGSCEVSDDGRGMPVDIHPEEKIPGVELILTRLHAGGKFSNKNYTFSGGLHGVGVSVVNALSKHVDVFIKRDGNEYRMASATATARRRWRSSAASARRTPAPACASGPTRSISTPRSSTCAHCATCCAPRRCCAPA
jgi:DNA gyrase/topoisomerase IV subunit B